MTSRYGFAGTSAYAGDCLRQLVAAGIAVEVLLSQPDRPAGRARRPLPPPCVIVAWELGIDVLQPERAGDARGSLVERGINAMAICAYGQLLDAALLDAMPWVNVHPSLLPRWRGAAPIERAILAGDEETGVAIMAVVSELDAGPLATVEPFPIGDTDDAGVVMARSLELGGPALAAALPAAAAGDLETRPQPSAGVTYATKLSASDRLLDPAGSATLAGRRVRALAPHVGAALALGGERMLVWRASPVEHAVAPGVVTVEDGRIVCGFADGALELLELQPAGKRPMAAAELLRGWRRPLSPATLAG